MSSNWCSLFLQDPRILIVDDEKDLADITAELLREGGAEVEIASDGNSGLVATERFQPDLIIADLMMPLMRGDQMLVELRKSGYRKPVLLLTGYGEVTNVLEALRHDAFDFLTKPVPRDILMTSVQKALRFEYQRLLLESELQELYAVVGEKAPREDGQSWESIIKDRAKLRLKNRRGSGPKG